MCKFVIEDWDEDPLSLKEGYSAWFYYDERDEKFPRYSVYSIVESNDISSISFEDGKGTVILNDKSKRIAKQITSFSKWSRMVKFMDRRILDLQWRIKQQYEFIQDWYKFSREKAQSWYDLKSSLQNAMYVQPQIQAMIDMWVNSVHDEILAFTKGPIPYDGRYTSEENRWLNPYTDFQNPQVKCGTAKLITKDDEVDLEGHIKRTYNYTMDGYADPLGDWVSFMTDIPVEIDTTLIINLNIDAKRMFGALNIQI